MNAPDLLVLSKGASNAPEIKPPARRWLLRIGIPAAVFLAVIALLLYTARGALVPATDVWVAPVVVGAPAVPDHASSGPSSTPATTEGSRRSAW